MGTDRGRGDVPRPDPALRRALQAKVRRADPAARGREVEVREVEVLQYPDGSVEVLVDLVDGRGTHRRVSVPFASSAGWLAPRPDPAEGAFEVWVALGEWLAGVRRLQHHRLPGGSV